MRKLFWLMTLTLGLSAFAAPSDDARTLMAAGKFDEAALKWEEALGSGASKRELRRGLPSLGRCYEQARNFPKALTAYQQALRFNEKDVDRLLDLARVYALVDLNAEAVELYKRVLVLDKDRHDARLALARLYVKTGRWSDARREGELYAKWEPRDPSVQSLLADVDEAEGDLLSGARRREQVLAREPSPDGYYNLGRLWARAGRWDEADAAFGRAEALGLRTGAVFLHRGAARWLKGDLPGARVFWRKAVDLDSGAGAAHFFLALAAREAGNASEVAAELRQASSGAKSDFLKELIKNIK
jgi:tetratricopeptide (TPR) repeat protein